MTQTEWKQRISQAVEDLGSLKFFPPAAGAKHGVMELLYRMVETPAQLNWLVRTMVDRVGQWHGTLEVRGVYCTRFKPKDGIEATCSMSMGFTPEELETAGHQEPLALPPGHAYGGTLRTIAEAKKIQ